MINNFFGRGGEIVIWHSFNDHEVPRGYSLLWQRVSTVFKSGYFYLHSAIHCRYTTAKQGKTERSVRVVLRRYHVMTAIQLVKFTERRDAKQRVCVCKKRHRECTCALGIRFMRCTFCQRERERESSVVRI